MLHKTRGIVLHSVKYSESSLVVKIYTESFGIQSYMVKGARSPRSKLRPVLFQPLTLLDLVVYRKERNVLQNIKEIRIAHPYQSLPFDIRKSSIALFVNEVVYRALGEEEPNGPLFEFLWNSFLLLDAAEEPFNHFHLLFTLKLTKYLGFYPRSARSAEHSYFNLSEGIFQALYIEGICLDKAMSETFCRVLEWPFENPSVPGLQARERDALLDAVLQYYRSHLPGFAGFRSAEVLHSVLS
jgi:DNA repair protein RecO (recombination protein O)